MRYKFRKLYERFKRTWDGTGGKGGFRVNVPADMESLRGGREGGVSPTRLGGREGGEGELTLGGRESGEWSGLC